MSEDASIEDKYENFIKIAKLKLGISRQEIDELITSLPIREARKLVCDVLEMKNNCQHQSGGFVKGNKLECVDCGELYTVNRDGLSKLTEISEELGLYEEEL